MEPTLKFKEVIKEYLDKRAQEDELFAISYANEKKNINECCRFIISEVKKTGRNGFADEEIFGIAVHYYDEEDIGTITNKDVRVIVNRKIELSEEDKENARKKAIDEFKLAEKRRIEEKAKKAEDAKKKKLEKKIEKSAQIELFEPSLF